MKVHFQKKKERKTTTLISQYIYSIVYIKFILININFDNQIM